jgi:hypothetical protein
MAQSEQPKTIRGVVSDTKGDPVTGVSSLTDNAPPFVIDGVVTAALFDFAPAGIESIQVLKSFLA